jgi:hypothetical protein
MGLPGDTAVASISTLARSSTRADDLHEGHGGVVPPDDSR